MKATVNTYLNIRTGTPEILPNNNLGNRYYCPGDVIDIAEVVAGQVYKGNSIWYKLQDGSFVWSGGVLSNPETSPGLHTYTNAEIAKVAVAQNQQYLRIKFPNILSVSDAVVDLNNRESHVIALYLEDGNVAGIPDRLEARMTDGIVKSIKTEIIRNVGSSNISVNQQDEITNDGFNGSVCCVVRTGKSFKVVTAGHVFSKGQSTNYGGELDIDDQSKARINRSVIGDWFFQKIDPGNDVALASIDNFQVDNNCISFENKKHYKIRDKDVRRTKVKVISNVSEPNERTAFILDYNTVWGVQYSDQKIIKTNIIVIGSNPDRKQSLTVSKPGDSGGCVYEPVSGDLVGLILGGNSKFTWVLSLAEIFDEFNYTLH